MYVNDPLFAAFNDNTTYNFDQSAEESITLVVGLDLMITAIHMKYAKWLKFARSKYLLIKFISWSKILIRGNNCHKCNKIFIKKYFERGGVKEAYGLINVLF